VILLFGEHDLSVKPAFFRRSSELSKKHEKTARISLHTRRSKDYPLFGLYDGCDHNKPEIDFFTFEQEVTKFLHIRDIVPEKDE
jgi:hypothetical protein